ncbi:hypothetical protein RB653_008509 [Dictyostelium firmibasis]|uniref:Uncharacterized protein n=1 Tax=Dictyostelium firmibasis TaxID=79012 RepID=A0AAN7YR77_9MYCE
MKTIFSIITFFSIITYTNLALASTQNFSSFIGNLTNLINDKTKSINLAGVGISMPNDYLNSQINQTYQTQNDLLKREQFSKLVNTIPPWSSNDIFILNNGSMPYMFNSYSDIINHADYKPDKTTFDFWYVKGQLSNYFRYSENSSLPGYYITQLSKPTPTYDPSKNNISELFSSNHQSLSLDNWNFEIGSGQTVLPINDQFTVEFNLLKVDINRSWFSPLLFTDRSWTYNQAGYVSDGNGNGTLPKYISSLLLINNITISLQQNQQNSDILAQVSTSSTSNYQINFGPILIKEQGGKISSGVVFGSNSIKISDIQMIAFVSTNVPFTQIKIEPVSPTPTPSTPSDTPTPSASNILYPSIFSILIFLILVASI